MHSELRRQGCLDCILEPDGHAQVYAIAYQTAEGRLGCVEKKHQT